MEVVRAYLNGEGGYKYFAKKFNVPASSNVHKWVVCFQEFGQEGLLRKIKNKKYTLDFKLEVVEYYLTTEISYQNLALKFGMNNPDKKMKEEILSIRKEHKDYGYRLIHKELLNRGFLINKKKVQRIVQKLKIQVTSFSRKSRKYSSYKGKVEGIAPNRIKRRFDTNMYIKR